MLEAVEHLRFFREQIPDPRLEHAVRNVFANLRPGAGADSLRACRIREDGRRDNATCRTRFPNCIFRQPRGYFGWRPELRRSGPSFLRLSADKIASPCTSSAAYRSG